VETKKPKGLDKYQAAFGSLEMLCILLPLRGSSSNLFNRFWQNEYTIKNTLTQINEGIAGWLAAADRFKGGDRGLLISFQLRLGSPTDLKSCKALASKSRVLLIQGPIAHVP